MISPAFDGARDMNEKLFCQTRGCLSEQVAQTASRQAAWLLPLCSASVASRAPTPGVLPVVLRAPPDAIPARGGRRAPTSTTRAAAAPTRRHPRRHPRRLLDAIAATRRGSPHPRRRRRRDVQTKNRQPYPAPRERGILKSTCSPCRPCPPPRPWPRASRPRSGPAGSRGSKLR